LRKFMPVDPHELLSGTYGEWVKIILFCGLFIALAGAVLPKRLTEKRYGKAVTVFTGLIFGIGLYTAQNLYNFNFESFGFLAIWLIVILTAFVTFGLMRMGMRKDIALSLTYCVMFLTFFLMTPSIYDSIAESFPILNLAFLLAFLYLVGTLFYKMFAHSKTTLKSAKELKHVQITQPDEPEIKKEIQSEEREERDMKHKTLKLTKTELRSVERIDHYLKQIISTLEKSDTFTDDQKQQISNALLTIGKTKEDIERGLGLLKRHIENYKYTDRAKQHELQDRFKKAATKDKRKEIQKEWLLEKRKIDIYLFIESENAKILQFLKTFDSLIHKSVDLMSQNKPTSAVRVIQLARRHLATIMDILVKLKKYGIHSVGMGICITS
jgi:hypothetical protein